jgi:hypothetical protein
LSIPELRILHLSITLQPQYHLKRHLDFLLLPEALEVLLLAERLVPGIQLVELDEIVPALCREVEAIGEPDATAMVYSMTSGVLNDTKDIGGFRQIY